MKKITLAVLFFVSASGLANAQYMCTEQGTVLENKTTKNIDGKEEVTTSVSTVESVVTNNEGVLSSRIKCVETNPLNPLAEVVSYSGYTYNPATGLTTDIAMTSEDFKTMMVDMIVNEARGAGQTVSESDLAELNKLMRIKGELLIELPAEPDLTAKIPNRGIKMTMATVTVSLNIWDAKYLGFESIETPAGKFDDCFKMSYVYKTTNPTGVEKQYCTVWYAKGVGEVKSVMADKKGNVIATQELVSVTKP